MTGNLQPRVIDLQHQTVETGLAARRRYPIIVLLTRGRVDGIIRLTDPAGLAAKTVAMEDLDAFDPQEVGVDPRDLSRQHLVEIIDTDIQIESHRKALRDQGLIHLYLRRGCPAIADARETACQHRLEITVVTL